MDISREELLSRLRDMDWDQFEELVADIWEQSGWDANVTQRSGNVTQGSGDDGTDVIVRKDSPIGPNQKHIIQAKCYSDKSISNGDLRDFGSAIGLEGADAGVFVTTSSFTPQAKDTADELNNKIDLFDGEDLCDILLDLENAKEVLSKYIKIEQQSIEENQESQSTNTGSAEIPENSTVSSESTVSDSNVSTDSDTTNDNKSSSDTYWRDNEYEDILSDSSTNSKASTESASNSSTNTKSSTDSSVNSSTSTKPSTESISSSSTSVKSSEAGTIDEEYYEYAQEAEEYKYSTQSSNSAINSTDSVESASDYTTSSKSTTRKTHPFDKESIVAEPTKDHDYFSQCQVCEEVDSIWYVIAADCKTELLKCGHCSYTWKKEAQCTVCDDWEADWEDGHPVKCHNCGTLWKEVSHLIRRNRWKAKSGPQSGESKTKRQWQKITE